MKKYTYEARDSASDQVVKSVVQADSENAAAKLLIAQGFIPLKIELDDGGAGWLSRLQGRITIKDRVVFTRQLATLIGAGLPLVQSLRTVLDQTANKQLQAVIQGIITDIESGKQLSSTFSKYPGVFDKIFIALVSAGEASGTLDDALRRIAAQQEKDAAMMSKIKGALTYPAIVTFVILAVVIFMLIAVVPQVKNIYQDIGGQLPLLTQILVSVADFITNFWWLVIAALVIAGYFFSQYLKTDSGIRAMDNFKLNVPLFSPMYRKLYMARFTRTAQTLLSTGVPMLDMLHIASGAVNNTIIYEGIERAAEKVKDGKPLSSSLKGEQYILAMVPQMIKIGEQSGKIDEMMGKSAQIYEDELDEEIRVISTAIEPILMVFLAIVAGGMVGAILFPIYGLVGKINM